MNDPGTGVAPAKQQQPQSSTQWSDNGAEGLYGLLAEFETPTAIYSAAERVRDAGYRWWDCHTPFPVHGLDRAMGIRPTILPWLVFGAGATGTTIGFILQWFTNATSFNLWAFVWVRAVVQHDARRLPGPRLRRRRRHRQRPADGDLRGRGRGHLLRVRPRAKSRDLFAPFRAPRHRPAWRARRAHRR